MSAQPKPANRHDVMFTMGDDSKAKVDALLRQCGHTNLPLLMARGLALVQWVEDQAELGHTVAGIVYGEEGVEAFELEERPELLKPRQRPQAVPTVAPVSVPASEPAPVVQKAPEPAPAPKSEPVATPAPVPAPNPKLVAREKKPQPPRTASRSRAPNRRAAQLRAHLPDDDGPVKTFTWVRWKCEQEKRLPPILIGDDRALPGELSLNHQEELERMLVDARHATHFKITSDGFLAFYGFVPGKGWHYLEDGSMQLRKDGYCDAGLFAIFPVVMAVEYLQRLANPVRELATA